MLIITRFTGNAKNGKIVSKSYKNVRVRARKEECLETLSEDRE